MAKNDVAKIERVRFFEWTGKNVQLAIGDKVKYCPPNGRPASFSFFRKDVPILFHGYPTIEHAELETPELFEQWFRDHSKLYKLGVDLDLEQIEVGAVYFNIINLTK